MEKVLSEEHKRNISLGVKKRYDDGLKASRGMLGKNHSKETKERIGLKNSGKKGYIPWNKGKTGIYSEEVLKKMSESHKGMKPWNYIDGRSKKLSPGRYGKDWKKIRTRILVRDDYQCKKCGIHKSKVRFIDVHHIIPFLISFDNSDNNLMALCRSCHQEEELKLRERD